METQKPLLKDADGEDVDEHLYRSMIGSLMYLNFSRPDIMFAQTVVANSTTEAEYIDASNFCRQVFGMGMKAAKDEIRIGRTARIESSDEAGLGDQEDASKQGRKIVDINRDAEVTLIDETQGRSNDNLMFDIGIFNEQKVKVEKIVSTAEVEVTTASATTTTADELTLAQTLIEIKAAKPKVVTTIAITTTTAITRPKARGFIVQEPNQIMYDQEVALNLQAQLEAKLEEEERLARQKEEEANIALIESWDNTQAMMETDFQMAQQLHAEEQEQLSIEEKSKLFVELMNKRKKHFAEMRAKEKRNKPPTQSQ
ncbi:hypothetical protein Tco_0731847 [Tanacetum coccineum]